MHTLKNLFLVVLLAASAGAASNSEPVKPAATNAVIATGNFSGQQYLKHMDKLLFRVVEDPNPSGIKPEEVGVSAQMEIEVHPGLGYRDTIVVNVANKTLTQVRDELKSKLEGPGNYYKIATVDLKVLQRSARESRVLFFGPGARGNSLNIAAGDTCTIFEGVYRVGVAEFANIHKVRLYRKFKDKEGIEVREFDMDEIRAKHPEKDELLQDGDRVEIPERRVMF